MTFLSAENYLVYSACAYSLVIVIYGHVSVLSTIRCVYMYVVPACTQLTLCFATHECFDFELPIFYTGTLFTHYNYVLLCATTLFSCTFFSK